MARRKRLLLVLGCLGAFHGLVLFAGFFAPYDYALQNRMLPFAPPTRIHFVDQRGRLHLRPFIYLWVVRPGSFAEYEEDQKRVYPIRLLVTGSPYSIAGTFTARTHLFGVDEPARIFLIGSDDYGRDQFSRLLYGGQVSLLAGLLAAGLSVVLGVLLGTLAGFYARWIDEAVMRGAEIFLALPWLYLLFAVRAFLPLDIDPAQVFLLLIVIVGVIGWARPARLVRGVVLSAKQRDYVVAARGFGARDIYVLRRHVIPETLGVVFTQATLLVPQYILAEVTLSFLGLGVSEPAASWGNMLASLQQYHVLASYWWMFVPGLALVPLFLGYWILADTLRTQLGTT